HRCSSHRRIRVPPTSGISPAEARSPPAPPLFPYTTLFRSDRAAGGHPARRTHAGRGGGGGGGGAAGGGAAGALGNGADPGRGGRSEEHTSELQSRENLVCRLLLEKKNCARTPRRLSVIR